MRFFKNVFSKLHIFILWVLISLFVWGFVFTRITDTSPDKKIVVYVDADEKDLSDLTAVLNENKPDGIRMIKVHSVAYNVFDASANAKGDIYILSDATFDEFSDYIADSPRAEISLAGIGDGLKVYAGVNSVHFMDINGTGDMNGHEVIAELRAYSNGSDTEADMISSYYPDSKIEGSSLKVTKVDNISDDFILGMDVSSVIAEENSGVKYYDFEGNEKDLLQILAENGVTHIRVRVWNHPYDENGNGYGGGNNDIDTAVQIGKRASKYGMGLIVDFHLSDFWADPGKQMVPLEWKDLTADEKIPAVHDYVRNCLWRLRDEGVDVSMVQIGNETSESMCGESRWKKICALMQAGSEAVREVYPDALVAVHFTNPERFTNLLKAAKTLQENEVDYDVFASSYYPFWHGTLENLSKVLSRVADDYDKKVIVMETSYAYRPDDTDFSGNTISDKTSGIEKPYPFTAQGQADCYRDVVNCIVNDTSNGIGVVYWEGAWITVGTNSFEENSAKWEKYGSGWASSYAGAYDPKDAGKYYGGSAVDNQAFFDETGHPLESLKVFNLLRYGN
ncbi:MAG: glycosyl hydrolase 53 family protein [Lachnospiraceae bacterium]|nr:glycosyl hydrolase 53 family protein [Lachnospiraceae bacterium]